ncbi:MAG: hypothetical protein N2323_03225 [candidate division WOR-3 bacterium]|nr:hypothetical protein [candidate division WOR-3 bacterium]
MKEKDKLSLVVRGFISNSPIEMDVKVLPVELFCYKDCVKEMEEFAVNLIKYADISLTVRLAREILIRLPGMFPQNFNEILKQLEKENEKENEKEI